MLVSQERPSSCVPSSGDFGAALARESIEGSATNHLVFTTGLTADAYRRGVADNIEIEETSITAQCVF